MKLAAIDIGSNALRLLICRHMPEAKAGGELKKVEFIRIPLRLGDDVFMNGKIGEEKKQLFLMAMNAFKLIMDIHQADTYLACATSAMREASNGDEIVQLVNKRFGLKLEIISGDRESQLILKSVLKSLPQGGNFLNIDVGGGSTEISLIKNGKLSDSRSFPIGTVRLLDDKVKKGSWKEMEDWVKEATKKTKDIRAIGTGGNISKLYRLSGYQQKAEYMPMSRLQEMYDRIKELSMKERISQLRLNPDRADVIEPAARIYLQIMQWAKVKELLAPQAGLKEGLIFELLETKGFY